MPLKCSTTPTSVGTGGLEDDIIITEPSQDSKSDYLDGEPAVRDDTFV
jgi:hypothetical protein